MKRVVILSGVVGLVVATAFNAAPLLPRAAALDDESSSLLIQSFKVTSSSGQFFELHNNSPDPIDMSGVQLAYYNHYDVAKATSSKLVSLSGTLQPDGYYLVNDSATTLCYQTMVASASLGFSSTAGLVQVHRLSQSVAGGPISSSVVDSVAWSKTAASGAQTLPSGIGAFLKRLWAENTPKTSGGGSWLAVQPSLIDPCQLESFIAAQIDSGDTFHFTPGTMPPVRYVAAKTEGVAVNRNTGKMAPLINELLPNPGSPQINADDEFIELYNPNDTVFDLSGFMVAFGSTNPRKFTFSEGTVLQPKSFKTFTSSDTSISLSNTEAQVWLLDPKGQIVSQSEPYSKAPDGQAWALNNGTWAWTTMPTPGELNAMSSPPGSDKQAAAALGINSTLGQNQTSATTSSAASAPSQSEDAAPLHPGILAGVGLLAVGYALYEYRRDMANRLFQLRRYLRNRRAARQAM